MGTSMGTNNVVAVCGSRRFRTEIEAETRRLTLAGKIVLAAHVWDDQITEAEKTALDALHLEKIDLADEVHFVNTLYYMGESTLGEYRHSVMRNKKMTFTRRPIFKDTVVFVRCDLGCRHRLVVTRAPWYCETRSRVFLEVADGSQVPREISVCLVDEVGAIE